MRPSTTRAMSVLVFLGCAAAATARAGDPPPPAPPDGVERDHPGIEAVFARRRGYLGLVALDIGAKLRAHYGAPEDAGVLVSEVVADGPAARAGVRVGDVLVTVGDSRIASSFDLRRVVAGAKEGTEVKLGLVRDGKQLGVSAKVVERDMPHVLMEGFAHGCVPEIDSDAIREMVERKMTLPRLPPLERRDDLEKRLKELEDKLDRLQKQLQGKGGGTRAGSAA